MYSIVIIITRQYACTVDFDGHVDYFLCIIGRTTFHYPRTCFFVCISVNLDFAIFINNYSMLE